MNKNKVYLVNHSLLDQSKQLQKVNYENPVWKLQFVHLQTIMVTIIIVWNLSCSYMRVAMLDLNH